MTIATESSCLNTSIESLRRETVPIIIFGAGVIGEILFYGCIAAGIKIDCFCDDKVKDDLCGLKVMHTSELNSKYQDAIFFIASPNIKDMLNRLADFGYFKWCSCSLLLRNFDLSTMQSTISAYTVERMEYLVSTCLLCHDNYINSDKLFLQSVDIIITERCSLKCRDCSNLMQYYKKPENSALEEILHTIDAFCSYMDEVYEFRVIGGEPFMNKDLHLIVDSLIGQPKVHKIAIFTNGTIIPRESQISSLQNSKVSLYITDYGKLSKNLNGLIQELQRHKIAFHVEKARGWTDCSSLDRHHRTIQQQEDVFKECCAKNLATLSDGKLYRCPFAANASRLGAIPDYAGEYIDFLEEPLNVADAFEMKKLIRKFLTEKTYLETCDHCNGRPYGAPEIIPAIQIIKPLEYKHYSS